MRAQMGKKAAVRTLPSEVVRQLWALVANIEGSDGAATLDDIAAKAEKTFGWSAAETEAYVKECCECDLLVRGGETAAGTASVYALPLDGPDDAESDWYCFVCHMAGKLLHCTACFRSFHGDCLPADSIRSGSEIVCAVCQVRCISALATKEDYLNNGLSFVQSHVRELYCDILTLSKNLSPVVSSVTSKFGSLLLHIPAADGPINDVQYSLLVVRPIDLTVITEKLKSGQYNHAIEFLNDFGLLLHNMIVVYGKDSNMAHAAEGAHGEVKEAVAAWKKGAAEEIRAAEESADSKEAGSLGSASSGQHEDQMMATQMSFAEGNGFEQGLSQTIETTQTSANGKSCNCSQKYKQYLLDMRDQWVMMFNDDIEKCYAELREKVRKKFIAEQSQVRAEMMAEFKRELENTREELNVRYANQLKFELQKLSDRHKKQLEEMKKKQWCFQCEAEAIYYCCWNTSYCSVECQQEHWPTHRSTCRRKKTT